MARRRRAPSSAGAGRCDRLLPGWDRLGSAGISWDRLAKPHRATEKGKLTGLTALHPSLLFTTLCHLLLTYFVSLCRTQIPTHTHTHTHSLSLTLLLSFCFFLSLMLSSYSTFFFPSMSPSISFSFLSCEQRLLRPEECVESELRSFGGGM